MIVKYKYGFIFNEVLYGWYEKELYRLPQMIGKRYYPLMKCGTHKKGYYVGRTRKSFAQLKSMTVLIDFQTHEISDKDCPF